MDDKNLIKEAFKAQKLSYAPYSRFHVGSALLAKNGTVFHGCNVEIAGATSSICAERTAVFKAVTQGITEFKAIVIVGSSEGTSPEDIDYCSPCGVCRQVMAEFCDLTDFRVILARSEDYYLVYSLEELLPHSFVRKDIVNKVNTIDSTDV